MMFKSFLILFSFLFVAVVFGQSYDVEWVSLQGVTYDPATKSVKNYSPYFNTNGASSSNVLKSGQPGAISYVITDASSWRIFGFNTSGVDNTINLSEIKIAAYIRDNLLWVYANNVSSPLYDTLSVGDTIVIEKDTVTTNVYLKKNSNVVYTYNYGSNTNDWIVEAGFHTYGGELPNVKVDFSTKRLFAENNIVHDSYSSGVGSIDLNSYSSSPPISYSWSNSSSSEDVNNLSEGSYSVTMNDGGGNSFNDSYTIYNLHDIEFDELMGCKQFDPNTIKKTNFQNGFGYSGCTSLDYIKPTEDGMFECRATSLLAIVGFREGQNTSKQSHGDIKYGIYFASGNRIYIRVEGSSYLRFFYDYSDKFSLERKGNDIIYRKNGDIFWIQENVTINGDWFVDIALGGWNYGVTDLKCSFPNRKLDVNTVKSNYVDETIKGSVDLDIRGGESPYTVVWGNGSTSSSLQNLNCGEQSFSVVDNNGESVLGSLKIEALELTEWENPVNGIIVNDCFKKNITTVGWNSDANSVQIINPNSGDLIGLEYKIDNQYNINYGFGFSSKGNQDASYTAFDLGLIIFSNAGGAVGRRLYVRHDGTHKPVCTIELDDIVRLEYFNNLAYVYVNDELHYTSSFTPASSEWVLDNSVYYNNQTVCDLYFYKSCNIVDLTTYSTLTTEKGANITYLDDDILNFIYDPEYESIDLKYRVIDESNNLVFDQSTQPISLVSGINKIKMNTSSLNTGQYYLLEVENPKKEKTYLRFYKN